MRGLGWAWLLALLLGACGGDRARSVHPQLVPPTGPFDFGQVPVLNERKLEVRLANVGRAALTVFSVRVQEEGTPFRVGPSPSGVERGGAATVEVFFKPTAEQPYAATLLVETDDPVEPVMALPLSGLGNTRAVLEVEPKDLCSFGRTPEGGATVKTLTLRSLGTADLVVEELAFTEDTSPAFSFIGSTTTPAVVKTRGPDGLPGRLQLTVKYTVQVGAPSEARGAVRIRSTDPDQPEVLVPLCGQVNRAPVCAIAEVGVAAPGATVGFDGSGSSDPDNNVPLRHAWRVVRAPAGAVYQAGDANQPTFSLKLDDVLPGEYEVELSATDADPVQPAVCLPPARRVVVARPAEALLVELFWDNAQTDVDLHLLRTPDTPLFDAAGDCHYANCRASPLEWGEAGVVEDDPRLSRDALVGYGPEVVGVVEPAPGTYRVVAHFNNPHRAADPSSDVTVRVYVRGVLQAEHRRALLEQGDTWPVVDVAWPSGTVTPVPTQN